MDNKSIFFVTGRLPIPLVLQKVIPFLKTDYFDNIFIFREEKGDKIKGAKYITIPVLLKRIKFKLIKKIFVRVYELIQVLLYTIKKRPEYVNGIFTVPKGWIAVIVSILTPTKSIISVIGDTVEIDTYFKPRFFWKRLNLFFLRRADIITTLGSHVTNYIINNGITNEKIYNFEGFVDTNRFRYTPKIKKDIDIIFVGTFRKLKGPDRIVKMIYKLIPNYPNIKAKFLGKGYLFEEVEELVSELHLNDNIDLLGYIEKTEKYYKRSKVAVMPSRNEGLGMLDRKSVV